MYDNEIIELNRWLQEARGEDPDRKIKARTAKIQQRKEDIKLLSEHTDLCSSGIAETLNLPVYYVEMEMKKARVERDDNNNNNKLKRQLEVATGHLDPYGEASVAIYQR